MVKIIMEFVDQELPFLFLGDFNFPGVDSGLLRVTSPISGSTSRFIDFCLDAVIHQHVREPTQNQISVLDLNFTRFPHYLRDITVDAALGKIDHTVLYFKHGRERAPPPLPSFRWIYIMATKHQLMEHAHSMNWTDGDPNNVEDLWGVIRSNIRELEEQYIPHKRISPSTKHR